LIQISAVYEGRGHIAETDFRFGFPMGPRGSAFA